MNIERIIIEGFGTNCYIVSENGEALVIDPGADAALILKAVEKHDAKIATIALTHGHFDHIMAVYDLRHQTGAQVLIHENDAEMLENPQKSLASKYRLAQKAARADVLLKDGDVFKLSGREFSVLHTPGHTDGSCCFLCGDTLFSGDTLFRNTVGIFERENKETMKNSIKRLLKLPENTVVYPGHMEKTIIGYERSHNPFASFDWEWE